MKKILALGIAAAMLLVLTACGGNDKTKAEPNDDAHVTEQTDTSVEKKANRPDGLTYDMSSPEEDRENAPGYVYFVQEIPKTDTELSKLAACEPDESYYDKVEAAFKSMPLFSRAEITQEDLGQNTEVTDLEGNPLDNGDENKNFVIYANDEAQANEVAIAVYPDSGYNSLSYGSMQYITDIESWQDSMDTTTTAEQITNITGMTLTEKDVGALMETVLKTKTELPDEAVYMASIMDPATYDSIQVTLLPYEGDNMVTITAARYIETTAN